MPPPTRVKRPSSITVGEFFAENEKPLKLKIVGTDVGFARKILEPSVNRPGLALSGFFSYFAYKRVQVIGNSELSFLDSLEPKLRAARFSQLCSWEIPCLIVARAHRLAEDLVQIANEAGISVFQTSMLTMKFLNNATIKLDTAFAPTQTVHGCLVDVQGIGVLIQGDSGTGKSEAVIGLLQRGASLVADDAVRLRNIEEREIVGMAPETTRDMIEIRGLGILNVAALFGVGSVRLSKRLDLIVQLVHVKESEDLERVGREDQTVDILGIAVNRVELPVAPGRDVAGLIELAALNYKLRSFGYNSAVEFDQRLLKKMAQDQLG
ncbi:HPr(Ser) kinase/phosphatase [Brevifollis gellanilyticus]|uniref:HPr kinase/phosphorylase n=1 Tax=Brevifollis gellanilyticus TaxID=748831 RepID=A0A512MBF9_9BACT|nr:HPr(Ser) kinase/phosphatase [Brevifollis gellanilyticus]GEP44058.1 HPr kinase/phosphorylase [Brevifollis gellanilyticus]